MLIILFVIISIRFHWIRLGILRLCFISFNVIGAGAGDGGLASRILCSFRVDRLLFRFFGNLISRDCV